MGDYQPTEIEINLEEVQAWDGEQRPLLPIGTYHVRVVNFEPKGKQISVEFEVIDGEQAGGRCYNNYNLEYPAGLSRLKCLGIACGAGLSRIISDEFVNAELYVDVVHNEGKSKPDASGNPMKAKWFANVQNERKALAEGESTGSTGEDNGDDGAQDPEPPPITREEPAKVEPTPAVKPAEQPRSGRARRT